MTKTHLFQLASTLLLVVFMSTVNAQDPLRIRSQGPLLPQFLESSTSKYEKQKAAHDSRNQSRSERIASTDFFLTSNFEIDRYFFDGEVFNNDFISQYLNDIVDHLLADDPEIREQVHVYLSKNPAVNAFATEQGIILVNIGLLSRVRNEAELAYILSHEIVHFKNSHALNRVQENVKMKKGLGDFRKMTTNDKRITSHSFKRAQELEADLDGLEIYRKSGYNMFSSLKVFEILDSAHLPSKEIDVDLQTFAGGIVNLPIIPDSVEMNEIELDSGGDEVFSTHPSTSERRDSVQNRIGTDTTVSDLWLVSKSSFLQSRTLCRREIIRQFCRLGHFERAIMQYYTLFDSSENDLNIDRYLAYAFYAMAMDRNLKIDHPDMDDIGGAGEHLHDMIAELSDMELTAFSLSVAQAYETKYPEEPYFKSLQEDLLYSIGYDHEVEPAEIDPFDEKIPSWISSYLVTQVSDSTKLDHISSGFADREADDDEAAEWDALSLKKQLKQEAREDRELTKEFKKGFNIPVNNLVVLNPFFISIDERERTYVDYLDSEEREEYIIDAISEVSQKAGITTHILDTKAFSETDVEAYEDMQLFHEWMDLNRVFEGDYYPTPNIEEVKDQMAKYDSKYVLYTGFFSVTYNVKGKGYMAFFTMGMGVQFLPHLWYRLFKPRNHTYFAYMLVDPVENKIVLSELREHKGLAPRESLIRNDIFHLFDIMDNE